MSQRQIAVRSLELLGRLQAEQSLQQPAARIVKSKKHRRKQKKTKIDHQQVVYEQTQAKLDSLKKQIAKQQSSQKARKKSATHPNNRATTIDHIKKLNKLVTALEQRKNRGASNGQSAKLKKKLDDQYEKYSVFTGLDLSKGIPYLKS
eukprot:gene1262-4471_t